MLKKIANNEEHYEEVFIVNYKDASKDFLLNEKQFHLGVIPTEQSNPRTKNLSATIQKNTQDGVKMILSADVDIPTVATTAFETPEFQQMVNDIKRAIDERKTILISSVGASGRMAIQLDSTWRKFWTSLITKIPDHRQEFLEISNCTNSIITGGDRALVRSVENFEDYMTFGARQVEEAGVGPGDIVLGLAECGLSASINGSVIEGIERGCNTYYIYCNPKDILCTHLERVRKVFAKEDIVKISLFVGNMAVAGSTRMEVTTVELLAAGAALEVASWRWLKEHLTKDELKAIGSTALELKDYADLFQDLLKQMSTGKALEGLAQVIELEAATYNKNGLVTYATHEYLPDIMTDTTERQPTFTLPPFKKFADPSTLVSWAYVKDPLYPSQVAWQHVFRRPIKGLEWTIEDYKQMGAAQSIINNPPAVGSDEVAQYNIGCEDDPSRYLRHPSILVAMDINGSADEEVISWFKNNLKNFDQGVVVRMGNIPEGKLYENEIHIPVVLKRTIMDLVPHLMIKLAFNLMSTGTMAKMGRVFGNWMIQVLPTNKKLIDRSTRIIANLAGISYEQANEEFFKSMLGRNPNEVYRESYVVETLKRLGFDPNKEIK
jgi:N-acetylmuramic acid 6-phosphate etherase